MPPLCAAVASQGSSRMAPCRGRTGTVLRGEAAELEAVVEAGESLEGVVGHDVVAAEEEEEPANVASREGRPRSSGLALSKPRCAARPGEGRLRFPTPCRRAAMSA